MNSSRSREPFGFTEPFAEVEYLQLNPFRVLCTRGSSSHLGVFLGGYEQQVLFQGGAVNCGSSR